MRQNSLINNRIKLIAKNIKKSKSYINYDNDFNINLVAKKICNEESNDLKELLLNKNN